MWVHPWIQTGRPNSLAPRPAGRGWLAEALDAEGSRGRGRGGPAWAQTGSPACGREGHRLKGEGRRLVCIGGPAPSLGLGSGRLFSNLLGFLLRLIRFHLSWLHPACG